MATSSGADQADTPDPIGECGDVPSRPDLWLPCDREQGHGGPHTWAMNPAYTPAPTSVDALAEQRDAMIWAAEQLQSERDSALAELAAARDREAAAGEPIRGRVGMDVRAVLRGRLIDYDSDGIWTLETDGADHVPWRINLHWAQPFLAALSQSEPTKETP